MEVLTREEWIEAYDGYLEMQHRLAHKVSLNSFECFINPTHHFLVYQHHCTRILLTVSRRPIVTLLTVFRLHLF